MGLNIRLAPHRIKVFWLLGVFLPFILGWGTLLALTSDDLNSIYTGTVYYEGSGADDCLPDGATSGNALYGDSNREMVFNYFTGKGLPAHVAAAFVGNFMTETKSTMDPRITQGEGIILDQPFQVDDNNGFGIAQWTDLGRKQRLEDFAEATNRSQYLDVLYVGDDQERIRQALSLQLDYVWFELTGEHPVASLGAGPSSEYGEIISDVPDVDFEPVVEATVQVNAKYERSALGLAWADPVAEEGGGGQWTEEIIQQYHGERIAHAREALENFSGSGSDYRGSNCVVDLESFSDYVLAYAHPSVLHPCVSRFVEDRNRGPNDPCVRWHEGRIEGYVDEAKEDGIPVVDGRVPPKAEYAQAVSEACERGDYVGAGGCTSRYPGIDCGGFVVRLMRDSGFDPNYVQGWTGDQEEYLEANWERLTVDGTEDLQPGDVAIVNDGSKGHVFVFVGEMPGFPSVTASSSQESKAPAAGSEGIFWTYGSGGEMVTWYRLPNY